MLMPDKMKALVYRAPLDIRCEDVEIPEVGDEDVLIKVISCAICGSELHCYKKGMEGFPGRIMGHEYIGAIAKKGKKVAGFEIGDRVWAMTALPCGICDFCQKGDYVNCYNILKRCTSHGNPGGMAEYVYIPQALNGMFKFPDEISDKEAVFLEPLSFCHMVVERAGVRENDKVVVFGAGAIGNGMMQCCKILGAKSIIIDKSELRLNIARECGADYVINRNKEDVFERIQEIFGVSYWYHGLSGNADVSFDCAGGEDCFRTAVSVTKNGGTIALVAPSETMVGINLHEVVFKHQRIIQPGGNNVLQTVDLMIKKRFRIDPLISHRFSLAEGSKAFATQADSQISMKVIIDMQ